MNIQTQCCGIVLLLVLLTFYLRRKKLRLNTEKAFMFTFITALVCLILDIVSIVCITYNEHLPPFMVEFVCKSYPASIIFVALSCLRYVCTDIFMFRNHKVWFARICGVTALLGIILVYVTPIYYSFDPENDVLYTYGPSIFITYFFTFIMILNVVGVMIYFKDRINQNRRKAVFIWISLWVIAAGIQFINNNLLLVGYAGCLGVMVLYLKLENPENNLDRRTGLFNQGAFIRYIRQLYSKKVSFSLLSIYFEQQIDDGMQEEIGDKALLKVVNYLLSVTDANAFRRTDEEFTLVFEESYKASQWLESIKRYFQNKIDKEEHIRFKVSMFFIEDSGMASKSEDLLYLLRYARQNSYEYSEEILTVIDKNFVDKMYQEKNTKRLILSAIEEDRVEVYYQPIYSTMEQSFTSAEALVRIKDEEGKIIPPGMFIDVAEKSGMILKLGEIVFRKVCKFIKENRIDQYGLRYIEVNLSVVQCADEHLAKTYIDIMEELKINPKWINLEITESASLNAKKILLDNMKCLMNYGVKFSLDDFGTGQSNLNYIVDMPVDIVKFDRDMINAYFENGKAKYVMNAAMHMIQGMELEIVSEGIETQKQYETMENLGINYIQGYYFSKPLPQDEFLKFISEKNVF